MSVSNEQINLCEANISLDEILKSIDSQKYDKSPGNDGFTAEFYKHFSGKLPPLFFFVFNSWGRLGTMGATSMRSSTQSHICHI